MTKHDKSKVTVIDLKSENSFKNESHQQRDKKTDDEYFRDMIEVMKAQEMKKHFAKERIDVLWRLENLYRQVDMEKEKLYHIEEQILKY